MSQHTRGIQRTATQRVPTRTVAGSYEAPVEGIVDYGAFQRGFESTFQEPEKQETIELQGLKKVFDGGAGGNKLTDGEDIYDDVLGNDLLRTWTKDNSSKFIKSDTEGQKNYLEKVQKVQKSINNKGSLFGNIGDHQLNDTNFNFNFIDENGKGIPGLTPAVINRIHGDPSFAKNRRIGTKDVIVDGRKVGEKAGEYMTISVPDPTGKGGLLKMKEKEIFINYEDMDENWQGNTFQLNYGHEASLSDNKPKGFENKVVAGQMLEKKYDQQTIVGGKTIEAGSTRNIISDDWYNDTEAKMNLAVDKVFNFDQGVMGGGYESAFRQFREQDFQLNPNTIKMLKDAGVDIDRASQITDEMAANIPDAEKVNMLRDWWVQSSLITNASIGYDKDVDQQLKKEDYTNDEIKNGFAVRGDKTIELFEKDGKLFKKGTNRAIENNVKIDRRYKEQPFDEDIDPKDTGPTTVASFMENIFSKFNAATSGASDVLKDSPIYEKGEEGGILKGDDAQNTLTLLRGREFNGKKIADVRYTKVGELKDKQGNIIGPDLRLQVFTQTSDKVDPEMSLVNISDAGSRREFLEDIARSKFGSGTTVSKEIAEAYTNIQTTRSDVQKVFKIYSDRLRKTLETGQWDDNIPEKYKAAFDAEMKKRKENSVNNDLNPN